MNFAVTLKLNHREEFTSDLEKLRDAVRVLQRITAGEFKPYLFELQPSGMHNMHVHLFLTTKYPMNFKFTHSVMKAHGINCDIKQLLSKKDCDYWEYYCKKERGDLAYDYASSTGNEFARINLFKGKTPATSERWDEHTEYKWWI